MLVVRVLEPEPDQLPLLSSVLQCETVDVSLRRKTAGLTQQHKGASHQGLSQNRMDDCRGISSAAF